MTENTEQSQNTAGTGSAGNADTAAVADRYRRLAAAMTDRIAVVPQDRWSAPSPCEQWTARELVGHLVDVHGMFLGLVGRSLRPGPDVAEDPLGAWTSARDQVQADLDDPDRADAEFDGFSGRSTFAQAVDRFVCFDLNIHGWDLARATAQDERIDPDELPLLWRTAESFGDAIRSENVCGPAVDVAGDAPEQDRLLGFLGRRP
jgi:uncharacterized protein (TIGR03086 family)